MESRATYSPLKALTLYSMNLARFGQLLGYRVALSVTGFPAVGAKLIKELGSDDEDVRVTAGMLLTRAGRRAEPSLLAALSRRENTPAVLEVLGSIGDPELEPKIQQLMTDPDPEISRAASDAHRVMQFQMHAPTPG